MKFRSSDGSGGSGGSGGHGYQHLFVDCFSTSIIRNSSSEFRFREELVSSCHQNGIVYQMYLIPFIPLFPTCTPVLFWSNLFISGYEKKFDNIFKLMNKIKETLFWLLFLYLWISDMTCFFVLMPPNFLWMLDHGVIDVHVKFHKHILARGKLGICRLEYCLTFCLLSQWT